MVTGLELFKTRFSDFADQYVLIGGAACTVAMQNVGVDFRNHNGYVCTLFGYSLQENC